jgi:hypothetical protein
MVEGYYGEEKVVAKWKRFYDELVEDWGYNMDLVAHLWLGESLALLIQSPI